MEENQNKQNEQAQQPEQQVVYQQPQQVIQQSEPNSETSVSMQIQQLLVQQQQYQQRYNQLVDYVKQNSNLPAEQISKIKQELDQLNSLFVQWKQKLQSLWYNPVQVNKPTEVKKWSKNNFSFRKLATWCIIVLLLIFLWFFVTLWSLKKNPDALLWMWIDASMAKILLQAFAWLLFWSFILLMLWLVISNIYRIITVKNQSKGRYVLWLFWWLLWAWIVWAAMWLSFWEIGKIVVEQKVPVLLSPVQPFLVWQWTDDFSFPYDKNRESWENYHLIAPSEVAFAVRWGQFNQLQPAIPLESTLLSLTLSCWNKQWQVLSLSWDVKEVANWGMLPFAWSCLYGEKWTYQYSLNVKYRNEINKEEVTQSYTLWSLEYESEFEVILNTTTSSSSNSKSSRSLPNDDSKSEFNLWEAPASLKIDAIQIFRDYWLENYKLSWDKEWDWEWDIENLSSFDVYYNKPQVYHPKIKFPDLSDFIYTFPVRVEPSKNPVCEIVLQRFPWSTRYQVSTQFIDESSDASIASYNYTIKNMITNLEVDVLKNHTKEFNYTFPEKGSYAVILDFVTVDWKQSRCQSKTIQLEKETFNVQYSLFNKDLASWKFKELCSSNSWCDDVFIDSIPQTIQLQVKSISPLSETTKKVVYLDDKPILNENESYTFDITQEGEYALKIITSDEGKWMDEETKEIAIVVKKPDIVWVISITSNDTNQPVSDWFEPLTVILDASKTEVNIPWDEIVYFTWDFWDGEIKQNQQNWVVAHTYNYDYVKENWIYQPKVTVTTRLWTTKTIVWPNLNIKKGLINVDLSSSSHPSRQAQVGREVTFQAEFDWLPEKMVRDFGDGTPTTTCQWRACTEVSHVFKEKWMFSVKLTLDFDAIQQVDGTINFKVY